MQCCFWQRCALTGLNAPEIIRHHQSGGVLRSGHPSSISSACCANSVRNIPKPWSASPFKQPPWIWYSKPPPEKIAASDWKNGQTPGLGEPSLHCYSQSMESFNESWRVLLAQIHRGVVGQDAPTSYILEQSI